MSAQDLNAAQSKLREKYEFLRNQSLERGAKNELDPNYTYAALMESVILSLGDRVTFEKVAKDLMGWLSYIGVIKRTMG